MAIEIIPKPKAKKKKLKLVDLSYYASALLLIGLLFLYIGFYFWQASLDKKLEVLSNTIRENRVPKNQALEKKIFAFKQKLDVFETLLTTREKSSQFFEFFKSLCQERVFYPNFKLSMDGSSIRLAGQTESLDVLREQIFIFEQEELIDEVDLSRVLIVGHGGIGFELVLSLAPNIFK